MISTIPLTKARINLGSIIKKVRLHKEYVVLEKDGYPVAGIMDIDEFEDFFDIKNPKIKEEIKKSASEYKSGKIRPVSALLKELKK